MPDTVTWESLRDLAAFRAQNGCAISLYLNLDPSVTPTVSDLQTHVNSLLDEAAKAPVARQSGLSHEQREGLRSDFERLRGFLAEFDRDGVHGLALFCAGLDGLWRPMPLSDLVPDVVKVNRQLFLGPLVPHVGRSDGVLVAAVSRERGEIFELHGGRLAEVADRTEEIHGQHDQGGWSQARYQRRIENEALDHLRDVAAELDRRVRRAPRVRIVIVCPEEARSDLTSLAGKETNGAIIGWASAEAHAGPPELFGAALPAIERWRAEGEAEIVERWREHAGRGERAASGWAETLAAASDARVDVLLVQERADRAAWRCPECGRAAATAGECPLDGVPMDEHAEGADLAMHLTLAHGGTVCVTRERHDLDPVEGIGAVLRF